MLAPWDPIACCPWRTLVALGPITYPTCPRDAEHKEPVLAKPNYSFEKRQRELAKKRKKEEKLKAKSERRPDVADGEATSDEASQEGDGAVQPESTEPPAQA